MMLMSALGFGRFSGCRGMCVIHQIINSETDRADYNTEEHDHDTAHLGWASACAPHKPIREGYDFDVLPDLESTWSTSQKSFIWDHKA